MKNLAFVLTCLRIRVLNTTSRAQIDHHEISSDALRSHHSSLTALVECVPSLSSGKESREGRKFAIGFGDLKIEVGSLSDTIPTPTKHEARDKVGGGIKA